MKLIPPLSVLLLSACAMMEAEEPITALFPNNAQVLACATPNLRDGQDLILTFGPGHERELAIVREAGETPYFLVVQSPPPEMRPLMPRDAFALATRVELPTSITGYKWVGEGGTERIFNTPGEYTVLISNSLEDEAGGHSCTVNYQG